MNKMTKQEVLEALSQKNLLKVRIEGRLTEYVDGREIYYDDVFHNRVNVYGVFFYAKYNKFEFFVTNDERGGMMHYYDDYKTEDEAYTAMYEYIERKNRLYNK